MAGAKLSRRLLDRESGVVAPWPQGSHHAQGMTEMLDKNLEEEQALGVDERLARVARIVVEQYDGDVKAFVESMRYRIEVNRKAEAASDDDDEAAFRKCPSTTRIIGRISRAHCS